MNNLEYLDLINRVIDNTATEKEKLRLQQLRDENPEVQKYYEKMTALCTILQRTPKIAPPHNFKDTIMHAIEVQGGKACGRKGIFRQLLRSFRPSPAVKYALAASGGLALGLVLYLYSGNLNDKFSAMDRSLLRGALLEPDNQETIVDKKTVSF